MGEFEATFAFVGGPGEGAFFVPEKFALHEVLRQGRAVELNERAVFAGRILCKARATSSYSAVFALDQHGGIGLRHALHELTQLLGGGEPPKFRSPYPRPLAG